MHNREDSTDRHLIAGALLDERSVPNLRVRFGALATRSTSLAVAIRRVRLMGVDLTADELFGLSRIRVLLSDLNARAFVAEADAVMVDPGRRPSGERILSLLTQGVLRVHVAPLAGWAPDFSIFSDESGPAQAIFGCHWFQRPYPNAGPAFATVCSRDGAQRGSERFEELWALSHDVSPAVVGMLSAADARNRSACQSIKMRD